MECPNCGKENHVGEGVCFYCRTTLPVDRSFHIKVSKAAVASAVLTFANLGIIALFLGLTFSAPHSKAQLIGMCTIAWLATAVAAIALGIIGLIGMSLSGGQLTGRGFAVVGIATPFVAMTLAVWLTVGYGPRCTAFRMVCGTNLSGLAKAMLLYANDYNDRFPRAAGPASKWTGVTPNWKAADRARAFGLDQSNGQASITASLYLLIRYAEVTPKMFVCKQDKGTKAFDPSTYGLARTEDTLKQLWDFGPNPIIHCSYSYHMPYGKYALTTSSDPAMAVAADRNPFQDSPFKKARDLSKFSWENRDAMKRGNAYAHDNEGQNVLFLDSHVGFEKSPLCGYNEDNIWTIQDANDIRTGKVPTIGSQPANGLDSLLVTDGAGDEGK